MENIETNNAKEMAKLAIQALQDKKAQDIHIIDISQVSVIARLISRKASFRISVRFGACFRPGSI